MLHEFHRGSKTTEAAGNSNGAVQVRNFLMWFARFPEDDVRLEDKYWLINDYIDFNGKLDGLALYVRM